MQERILEGLGTVLAICSDNQIDFAIITNHIKELYAAATDWIRSELSPEDLQLDKFGICLQKKMIQAVNTTVRCGTARSLL